MRALALVLVATEALGYESVCFQYPDDSKPVAQLATSAAVSCTPAAGPNTVRHRWVGPLDEHRELFERARAAAGLPTSVSDTFSLDVFTSDAVLLVGAANEPTLIPVPFAQAKRKRARPVSIGELSQLPDFSYGLWDWVTGNETCPLPGYGDSTLCHDFATHMGPVNSNHFLPQAKGFYLQYHQQALDRADACKAMANTLGAQSIRFTAYLQQCELEALALEAVGQHYLQDAWSTGHMWARWGSPEISDFPGTGDEPRDRAVLISLIAGLIHGSRGVLQRLPNWTTYDVNDALCAPQATVQFVTNGKLVKGLGDDYLGQLPADLTGSDDFSKQSAALMSCATTGLIEVYAHAGMQHGPPGPTAGGLTSVSVDSDACFGQRVTNAALAAGAGLQLKVAGNEAVLPLDSRFVSWLVPKVARATGEVAVDPKLRNEFRFSLMRSMVKLRLLAKSNPDGTEAANGAMGPLVGVAPNSSFAGRSPAASYLEPALPWPGPASRPTTELERSSALALLFSRGHAADWCARTDAAALAGVQAHVADTTLDAEAKVAACDACVELAQRHLRMGTGPAAYDVAREPLCKLLDANAAVVYAAASAPGDLLGATHSFCGCP
jgi:hypothetical protein